MLSRPVMVATQGRPAAGIASSGRVSGEYRSAARSTRLRRYVVVSGVPVAAQLRRSGQPVRQVVLLLRGGPPGAPDPASPGRPGRPGRSTIARTRRVVVHSPFRATRTVYVSPSSSTAAGSLGGDHRLPVELLPPVAEPQATPRPTRR